jgi:hypothetical protein
VIPRDQHIYRRQYKQGYQSPDRHPADDYQANRIARRGTGTPAAAVAPNDATMREANAARTSLMPLLGGASLSPPETRISKLLI